MKMPLHDSVRILTELADSISSLTSPSEISEDSTEFHERITQLQELEVTGRNNRYSKKDNPAYELMKRIRASKDLTDPRILPEYSENYYNKIVLGLNNENGERFRSKDKFHVLDQYIDTAAHTGFPVLLLSLHETAGTKYHSLNFLKDKLVVHGKKNSGIDDLLDHENVDKVLEDILCNVDIYNGDIVLMQQRFISPIGHLADNFYRYSLNDTVILDGRPHAELVFAPAAPQYFGFNGRMLVDVGDSACFIRRVEMRVPRLINLNYVDNVFITQDFYRDEFGKRHLAKDDISLELTIIPGTDTFYARRLTEFGRPEFSPDKSLHNLLFDVNSYIVYENDNLEPWNKWEEFRLTPLSKAESGMGSMMNQLRRYPFIYWGEKILKILVNGYVATSRNSKVDLGPINTLISYNSIEGVRLRVGGLTTAALSSHWFGRGYLAYGCKDRKFKYNAEIEYSLIPKQHHSLEFPVNSIKLHYSYELDAIGQHYYYTNADNVFLSLKRKSSKLSLYKREAGATYQLELPCNLSFIAAFSHSTYESTPWLPFTREDGSSDLSYVQAGFRVEIRYAPGEKFLQTRGRRYAINKDAPIIRLIHEYVPKSMLGSAFCLNKTTLNISKRIWLSMFGYCDAVLSGGKIWSQVEYPALLWPNANLSYTIQPESYSLMNPMEFPLDYYGSIDVGYFANGLLFNLIPGINRLKLREVVTFKGLMGGLTRKNDPDHNPQLYRFPEDAGVQRLGKKPYMELGIGIDNILTCLRLDYIWRLTYRELPGAPKSGLRLSLHFSF